MSDEKIDVFEAENAFYLHSDPSRISKFLAQAKLYEMSLSVPGDFVEVGVFKGASFCRFRKLAALFHPEHARQFIGFDVFGKFPEADWEADRAELERQWAIDGDTGVSRDKLHEILDKQGLAGNIELIEGDVRQTLPKYFEEHDDKAISIVNIDLDLYEPIKTTLEVIFPRVPRGGIVILDDYSGGFPGARRAVDEYLKENGRPERLQKYPWAYTPTYLIKE